MIKLLFELFGISTGIVDISLFLSIIATVIGIVSIYIHYSNYLEKRAKIKVELLPINKLNSPICFSLCNNCSSLDINSKRYSAILHTRIINKSEKPIYIIEFLFKIASEDVYLFNKNSYEDNFIINKVRIKNTDLEEHDEIIESNQPNIKLLKPIIKLEPYEVIEGLIKFEPLPKFEIIRPTITMKTSRKNIKVRIGPIDFNSHYITLLDL